MRWWGMSLVSDWFSTCTCQFRGHTLVFVGGHQSPRERHAREALCLSAMETNERSNLVDLYMTHSLSRRTSTLVTVASNLSADTDVIPEFSSKYPLFSFVVVIEVVAHVPGE